jgi:hypothetical protein
MALSDYLTSTEWNGMFYMFAGPREWHDLGQCMHVVIEELLKVGYCFEGLDEKGQKKEQVGGGVNTTKLAFLFEALFGRSGYESRRDIDPLALLADGRAFIKDHAPALLHESDESWEEMYDAAKAEKEKEAREEPPLVFIAHYRADQGASVRVDSVGSNYRVVYETADTYRDTYALTVGEAVETFAKWVQEAEKGKKE